MKPFPQPFIGFMDPIDMLDVVEIDGLPRTGKIITAKIKRAQLAAEDRKPGPLVAPVNSILRGRVFPPPETELLAPPVKEPLAPPVNPILAERAADNEARAADPEDVMREAPELKTPARTKPPPTRAKGR
jgi:hypothetical protein